MLNQTAVYALRAMGYLAAHQDRGPILAQTIAGEMAIPRNFLSKIMNRLVRAGLVRSLRGTNGGFVLARPPAEITMVDVVSPFMDLAAQRKCLLGSCACDGSCRMHRRWRPIADHLAGFLENTAIDEIL